MAIINLQPAPDPIVQQHFPNLSPEEYKITSEITPDYNCIAWAVGDDQRRWWPDSQLICYWPPNIPRLENLNTFIRAFSELGFVECEDEVIEYGYEKIAIFTENGIPTHAARQLDNGNWTSKLGSYHDIEHSLNGMSGGSYGVVAILMKRVKQ